MTAEEKAKELIEKFSQTEFPIACALICVDEILDQQPLNPNYWQSVRAYIEGSK